MESPHTPPVKHDWTTGSQLNEFPDRAMSVVDFDEVDVEDEVLAPIDENRIPGLGDFYNKIPKDVGIVKDMKGTSSKIYGPWFVTRFEARAKSLKVQRYVYRKKEGGIPIPKIAELSEYVKYFERLVVPPESEPKAGEEAKESAELEQFATKEELRQEAQTVKQRWESALQQENELRDALGSGKGKKPAEEETERLIKQLDYAQDRADRLHSAFLAARDRYDACLAAERSRRETKEARDEAAAARRAAADDRHQRELEKAHERAKTKHTEDSDAVARLHTALDTLKTWTEKQVEAGCPEVGLVVHAYYQGKDPMEETYMRAVWNNLLKRYRKESNMGVTSTAVGYFHSAIHVKRSMTKHVNEMQELIRMIQKLTVDECIKECVAWVYIATLSDTDRNAYMDREDSVDAAMERMAKLRVTTGEESAEAAEALMKALKQKGQYHQLVRYAEDKEQAQQLKAEFKECDLNKGATKGQQQQKAPEPMVFANTTTAPDRPPCYNLMSGKCKRGASCPYSHTPKPGEVVPEWFLAKQKKSAPAPASTPASAPVPSSEPAKRGVVAAAIHDVIDFASSSDEDDIKGGYPVGILTAKPPRHPSEVELFWDTGTFVHVATSPDVLVDARRCREDQALAMGIGGSARMTHIGNSDVLQLPRMRLIMNEDMPHLKSVGRSVQRDQHGQEAIALFTAEGAVQVRATPEILEEYNALVRKHEAMGLVEGRAELRNYLYVQKFNHGAAEPVAETTSPGAERMIGAVSVNLFAGRVKVDGAAAGVDVMYKAGVSGETLLQAVEEGVESGLPKSITKSAVKKYLNSVGKDTTALEATITRPTRRVPLGHVGPEPTKAGESLMLDNLDPPFARVAVPVEEASPPRSVMKKAKSIHGYVDAVLVVDEFTKYCFLIGRRSKKDPHLLLEQAAEVVDGRWNCLAMVKCDAEFVTEAALRLAAARGWRVYQAPPGEHAMVQGQMEAHVRWILDQGQVNMNRLQPLVERGVITDAQRVKLWFHALLHAVTASNLKPATHASIKGRLFTRLEAGTGKHVTLSNTVMLPFGMPVVAKRLSNDGSGRGLRCLYLGASATVPGGILVWNPRTDRMSVLYQFIPIPDTINLPEREQQAAVRDLFQQLRVESVDHAAEARPLPDLSAEAGILHHGHVSGDSETVEVTGEPIGELVREAEQALAPAKRVRVEAVPVPDVDRSTLPYQTRNVHRRVLHVDEELDNQSDEKDHTVEQNPTENESEVLSPPTADRPPRPPKPALPPASVRRTDPRWIAADERETDKLLEARTFEDLPTDESGREIYPENAMFHRLLLRHEYKWKPDPETGEECWLECTRCVADGSVDKRKEINCYSETPERALIFLSLGVSATLGEFEATADVVRAYLNAASLDTNIVIIAPPQMPRLPRRSRLAKGLYGERKATQGWDIFIDGVMKDLGWTKLDLVRSTYIKVRSDGVVVRAVRHSDDIKVAAATREALDEECARISGAVKMTEWKPVDRFLGVEIERVDQQTGKPDREGHVVLIRQRDKIEAMHKRFGHLIETFCPKWRPRNTPGPVNAHMRDDELHPDQAKKLEPEIARQYQELVGTIVWLSHARPDVKYNSMLLSKRAQKPRLWDMQCAVWAMQYLMATADTPLVLGGEHLDPQATSDSSFATMDERETVIGHGITMGPLSGVIEAHSTTTKCAATSVWETELIALVEAVKSEEFVVHAMEELRYPIPAEHRLFTDNEGVMHWSRGDSSNRRSRHIDVRYWYVREGGVHSNTRELRGHPHQELHPEGLQAESGKDSGPPDGARPEYPRSVRFEQGGRA